MSSKGQCAKCGSSQMIPGVRVIYNAEGVDKDLQLRLDEHPNAAFFKRPRRSGVSASVCGSCGYIEFSADAPDVLYATYLESRK